jgi:hypothetical protein
MAKYGLFSREITKRNTANLKQISSLGQGKDEGTGANDTEMFFAVVMKPKIGR